MRITKWQPFSCFPRSLCECVYSCAFLYAVKCNAYGEKSEKKASRDRNRREPPAAATVARTTNCGLCRGGGEEGQEGVEWKQTARKALRLGFCF